MVVKLHYFKNPFVGLYVWANNNVVLVPKDFSHKFVGSVEQALEADVVRVSVASTSLLGLYLTGNDKLLLVPSVVEEGEFKEMQDVLSSYGLEVMVWDVIHNALGNNVLMGARAALVSPHLKAHVDWLTDVTSLRVDVWHSDYPTPGSVVLLNSYGAFVHYALGDEQLSFLKEWFQLESVERGTLNKGVGFVGYGAVVNDKGFVVGSESTGFEIGDMTVALGFV